MTRMQGSQPDHRDREGVQGRVQQRTMRRGGRRAPGGAGTALIQTGPRRIRRLVASWGGRCSLIACAPVCVTNKDRNRGITSSFRAARLRSCPTAGRQRSTAQAPSRYQSPWWSFERTSTRIGVGLAAAVGFRVFLPLLVMSGAAYTGHLTVSDGFAWLSTPTALAMLTVAAVTEVLAYYVPGVDNLLDAVATPAALVAGTIAAAAVMTDLPPIVKWTTAVIAGGGAAGLTQSVTSLLRAKSTVMTGGLGNVALSTGELGGALLVSLLALLAPLAALGIVVLFCWLVVRLVRRVFSPDAGGTDSR
jgi:hypothetical protein